MSHTPGPWHDGNMSDCIISDDASGYIYDPESVEAYGGYLIAESVAPCNKPLIKAAPDLLAACKAAHDWLDAYGEHLPMQYGGEQELEDQLRAAIAKAEAVECLPSA